MINVFTYRNGFTLIELLVVVAIIGLLSSSVLASLNTAREKSRDARRITDMKEIQKALELYYDDHLLYPSNFPSDGTWEGSDENDGNFLQILVDEGYLSSNIVDPINSGSYIYSYYLYSSQCGHPSKGRMYVLGVRNMETTERPHPSSPGWECSYSTSRDWQLEFDWVTGAVERP